MSLPKIRKLLVLTLCLITIITLVSLNTKIATTSENLNWLFVSSIYLTISILLWSIKLKTKMIFTKTGMILRYIVFGIGYFTAIFGFFFILIASDELKPDQTIWLDENLYYSERNIGQGPDPSERLKKIEVYQTVDYIPFIIYRIRTKTYDEWNLPLQKQLSVFYSTQDKTIFLKSFVKGYKDFSFTDKIKLN